MKPILVLTLSALSMAQLQAEPPRPHHGSKLIIVNDDGFSSFHSGRYKTAADLRKAMLDYQDTQVAVMEWCILAGSRSNYPSKVTELFGEGMTEFPRRGDKLASDTVHRLAAEGVNTTKIVTDACHEAGIACYASLRMNGDYPEEMWGGSFPRFANSTFWWQHPEFRQRDAKGKVLPKFSFAFPEVREFKLAILREVAEQDIDGINLDFQRHPPFFGFEEPMAKAFEAKYHVDPKSVTQDDPRWVPLRYEVMNEFVQTVRELLDEAGKRKGRHLGLSARIDWQKYPVWGCDIATWLKKGWLDYLVVGQYGLGGYDFDIAPFVQMAKGSGCAVLFGEEATVKGHDRTAEEDRLIAAGKMKPQPSTLLTREHYEKRAATVYAAGADGLHLFNEGRKPMFMGLADVMTPGESPAFRQQLDTIRSGFDKKFCWVHPRAGVIPGATPSVVLTMQKLMLTGSDVFYALNDMRTDDLGKTWSGPTEHTDTLGRRDEGSGVEVAASDFWPKWHEKSGKLLGIGHNVRYKGNKVIPAPVRTRETVYSVYDPDKRAWTAWETLAMPDEPRFFNCGAGCVQRLDLPDGDILLPVYFSPKGGKFSRVVLLRCGFDGRKLSVKEVGNELAADTDRGVGEPSITVFRGRYYLTLRHDQRAYVATSADGLHFGEVKAWTWDDGSDLGSYNTQAHWVTHDDALYLVYTRRGADNDHIPRNRAPLFIGQVDPEKLQVLRATERILVPERGARLGNFGVTEVSEHETWVTVAEWMQTLGPNYSDAERCMKRGSDNAVFAARILWKKPNTSWNQR